MSTAKKINLVSVEDYLAGELISPIKHGERCKLQRFPSRPGN